MQAQIEIIKTKTQLQTSSQPKGGALPLGIKNFLSIYNGSKKSNGFKYENTSVKWATPADINEIIKLHETVYEGNYPYHENPHKNISYAIAGIKKKMTESKMKLRNLKMKPQNI